MCVSCAVFSFFPSSDILRSGNVTHILTIILTGSSAFCQFMANLQRNDGLHGQVAVCMYVFHHSCQMAVKLTLWCVVDDCLAMYQLSQNSPIPTNTYHPSNFCSVSVYQCDVRQAFCWCRASLSHSNNKVLFVIGGGADFLCELERQAYSLVLCLGNLLMQQIDLNKKKSTEFSVTVQFWPLGKKQGPLTSFQQWTEFSLLAWRWLSCHHKPTVKLCSKFHSFSLIFSK